MNKISKEQMAIYADQINYSDIEAIGFEPVVHTTDDIHVLANIVDDPETQEEVVLLFHDRPDLCGKEVYDEVDSKTYVIPERVGSLMEGFRYWMRIGMSKNGYLSIHNSATYDQVIVEKVVPKCIIPDHKYIDTMIQSKVQYFDRPTPKGAKSGHGLQGYGILHGIKKPEIKDFTVMDANMLHRVVEDCRIQKMTHKYLERERGIVLGKTGIDFADAYAMEYAYAKTCVAQELYGALVDVPHMERCVEVWDNRLHELEGIIEPNLPPTVKPQGTKVSRKEMAIVLGYPKHITDQMTEPMEMVKRKGEMLEVPVKPYYKPTTKWTVEKKANNYSGMNISYGFSPSFLKKKDLTDWIKSNHPDTKPKDWDIEKSETVTTLLNSHTCKYFEVEPEDVNIIGGAFTKVKFESSTLTQHEVVKGELIKAGLRVVSEWNFKKDDNGLVKATEDMIVSYPAKASYENQLHYTVKKGEPIVTSPKFGEKEYEQLETEFGKQVGEYNTTQHRRRYLSNPKSPDEKGLLAHVREDGRIPCGVFPTNTGTTRSTHKLWVNPPSDSALYGKEIRKSIIVPENKILVSHDMNSAQLSIAAYYANNFDFFKAVCFGQETKLDDSGNDILHPDTGKPWYIAESGHCVNMRAFGLVSEEEVQRAILTQDEALIKDIGFRRKKSKGATFGVLFGCSGKKLATMLGIDESEGNARKNMFLQNIGLDRPMAILEEMCEKNKRGKAGYIELPFGYYAACSSPHARFNYLDQGTEAVCQKYAELYFDRESKKMGLPVNRILSYHR